MVNFEVDGRRVKRYGNYTFNKPEPTISPHWAVPRPPKVYMATAVRPACSRYHRQLARAARECDLLPEFVRLADYVSVEALVELIVKTWAGFLAELLKPRRQSGLLETTVRFSEEGSAFAPACAAIQAVLAATAAGAPGRVPRARG